MISDARIYAGKNPGTKVFIKKQVEYASPVRYEVWKEYCNYSREVQDWSSDEKAESSKKAIWPESVDDSWTDITRD